MCGISGFNWEDKNLVRTMNKALAHRGPDDEGVYTDKNVSLGHKRLSIIDLTKAGHQPMSNEDGTIWITYNGEIYNFKEIKKELEKKGHKFKSNTDTEVIIHSYKEYGEKCLSYFNGIFAFCIYDSNKKILFLARDRIGVKPLYYYFKDGNFIFSSEIKAILAQDVKKEINKEALHNFVTYGHINGEQTIFKNIKRLLSANYLLFDLKNNEIEIKKYWDFKEDILPKSEDFHKKQIMNVLEDSVRKQLISDVPLGAYLSGGIDSSAIVAIMSKIGKETNTKVKTFSVAFEHGEKVNELSYAKKVSEVFGTEHREFVIKPDVVKILPKLMWHFDEPFADAAAIPVYELSRNAKKHVTVVLTGDGGDEIFAGYDQYKFLTLRNKIRFVPKFMRKTIGFGARQIPPSLLDKIYKHSSDNGKKLFERFSKFLATNNDARAYDEVVSIFDADEEKELIGCTKQNYAQINEYYFNKKWKYLNKLLYYDTKNLLPERFLMKTDRMTMAWAIEGRVPLLDHRLVEYGFKIHPKYKMNGWKTKYIFRKALENLVPKEILYRGKQTFHVPMDKWIEKYLKKDFQYILDKSKIEKEGFFNHNYVEKAFKNFNNAKLFYGRQLWSLVCFETWYKEVFEK